MASTKQTGNRLIVSFAVADTDANPSGLTYGRLGMMRTKEFSVSYDTVDTTGDTSPDFTRTSQATFKTVKFSGDCVLDTGAAENQVPFISAVFSPGSSTSYQPNIWFKLEGIEGDFEGPFTVSNLSFSSNHDGERTWSFEATSNGAVTFTQ